MASPYEAPRAILADPEPVLVPRPGSVTIGLLILWLVLITWLLGSIPHLRGIRASSDPWAFSYPIYLIGMIVIPAWLLVMIALARNWARVAAMMLQGLDFLWRVYLLVAIERGSEATLPYLIIPAAAQTVAFLLLCLPASNAWFRARPGVRWGAA